MRIAVVGAGIGGLSAARLLSSDHDVHLFEAEDRPGGHTHTIDVEAFGRSYALDTGFMVYNEHTYPNFTKMLARLGVASRESDMSFSVRCDATGLEYNGSSWNGLFARRRNLFDAGFHRMIRDVLRFYREGRRKSEGLGTETSLGEFVSKEGYGREFVEYYLKPMGASIWSASPGKVLDFPARFIIGFFDNHGLLRTKGQPTWRTIVGGARTYVEKLIEPLRDKARTSCRVERVERPEGGGVRLTTRYGEEEFDAAVMASHADQTLAMLKDADDLERSVLSRFRYQSNEAAIHVDAGLMPRRRRAWASWNYLTSDSGGPVAITYHLNQLQGHRSPEPLCATLNRTELVSPSKLLRRISFRHPVFDAESIEAQGRHGEINGRRNTYYCGAYWGNGFHEDGVNSALAVARLFGKTAESW